MALTLSGNSKPRISILGAGFGGLELSTSLSEALGDSVAITLLDKSDSFVFGFAKLDVMFGRKTADQVKLPYASIVKPGVYAIGDLANTGAPKAGVFAEGAAKTVAKNLIALLRGEEQTAKNPGAGSCYLEVGGNRIARVDVDFFSGPKATGVFYPPTEELRAHKNNFGDVRRARWFGLP